MDSEILNSPDKSQNIDIDYLSKSGMDEQDLVKMLLVAGGYYPGGLAAIYERQNFILGNNTTHATLIYEPPTQLRIQKVRNQFTTLGLHSICEPTKDIMRIYFAYDEAILQQFISGGKSDIDFGKFYGYSQTAIDAFIAGNGIFRDDLPSEILNHEYIRYLPFRMSQEHFQEEWPDFVHKVDMARAQFPNIFADIVRSTKYVIPSQLKGI